MNITTILTEIDAQIARLQQAKALLTNAPTNPATTGKKRGRPRKDAAAAPVAKKRTLSPEARAKIAAATKARWAKQKKGAGS